MARYLTTFEHYSTVSPGYSDQLNVCSSRISPSARSQQHASWTYLTQMPQDLFVYLPLNSSVPPIATRPKTSTGVGVQRFHERLNHVSGAPNRACAVYRRTSAKIMAKGRPSTDANHVLDVSVLFHGPRCVRELPLPMLHQ